MCHGVNAEVIKVCNKKLGKEHDNICKSADTTLLHTEVVQTVLTHVPFLVNLKQTNKQSCC